MDPILLISLCVFGLLFVITYLSVIGLYYERRHKEEIEFKEYNSSNSIIKKKPFGVRALYAYIIGLIMIGLTILVGTLITKYLTGVFSTAVLVNVKVFTCIGMVLLTIGVFIWILTNTIAGPVVVNIGSTIISVIWLITGMIELKWYVGLAIGLGILFISLAITYILTCSKKHNMNKYCISMLCIGLSVGIIISTIELFITFKLWWIILIGVYALITVISFINQVSKNKESIK